MSYTNFNTILLPLAYVRDEWGRMSVFYVTMTVLVEYAMQNRFLSEPINIIRRFRCGLLR